MKFVRIGDLIFSPEHVVSIWRDPKNVNKVVVHFDTGAESKFEGAEAVDVFRYFDDQAGWKEGDVLGRVSE